MKDLMYLAASVADVLLPRICTVCGRRLSPSEIFLCQNCRDDIPFTYSWDREYHPAADRFNEAIQKDTVSYEPYSRVASLFFYDESNGYRHICHRLKYMGDTGIGRHFGKELGIRLAGSPLFRTADTVVPVPLHWQRRWSRGYNQAAVIGREIAAVLGARFCPRMLVRKKNTVSQTTLDDRQKRENVQDAFAASDRAVHRYLTELHNRQPDMAVRHILITDDVFTSGATTAACHKALRKVFPPAVRISVATLAAVDES